ncbi:CoA transferase [Parafrankia sp. FMc2]|uniref:CoA transferase n=1 Tax=Parafrankia sp. FMc2 TaxID=3233196 RepID=UPI0034D56FEF
MFLADAICAGLVHVLRTGTGVVVDTALLHAAAWTLCPDLAYASLTGDQIPMTGSGPRSPLTYRYRTSDRRFVNLMMLDKARYWAQACRAVGPPELIDAYPDAAARRTDWPALRERFRAAIAGFTRTDPEQRLRAEDCIFAVYAAPPEVIRPGHHRERLSDDAPGRGEPAAGIRSGTVRQHPAGHPPPSAPPRRAHRADSG